MDLSLWRTAGRVLCLWSSARYPSIEVPLEVAKVHLVPSSDQRSRDPLTFLRAMKPRNWIHRFGLMSSSEVVGASRELGFL